MNQQLLGALLPFPVALELGDTHVWGTRDTAQKGRAATEMQGN